MCGAAVEPTGALSCLLVNIPAEFCGNKHFVAKRFQAFAHYALTFKRPVSLGSVEKRYPVVNRLMNELPEKQRLIMQLRDVEGKSYKEIADILQITEEQVKVTLFRARQKIKQRYTEIEDYGL